MTTKSLKGGVINKWAVFYDRIYTATEHILNNDFKSAQKEINAWEKERIKTAGKKSLFYKYKNGEKE